MKVEPLMVEAWGLEIGSRGELSVGGCSTVTLAKIYGTPLHVVNENGLTDTAQRFQRAFKNCYPGRFTVHYAFKCNSVPGVARILMKSGLKAEVMSEFELKLALHIGFRGEEIIINGPYKPEILHRLCLENHVRFIIIDSISELKALQAVCESIDREAHVLLRLNPDFIPRKMNKGTATGSRKGCAFGLDTKGGEVEWVLERLPDFDRIRFDGFQFHVGTGIRYPRDYYRVLKQLKPVVDRTRKMGHDIRIFDVGGGFASITTREMTTWEMLLYQGWERLPSGISSRDRFSFRDFAEAVTDGLYYLFSADDLPELILEPGRCIASPNQLLLLTVIGTKERSGIRKWLLTDGGIGTVATPTYYEYHEVYVCNDMYRPLTEKVTIIGPVCFAGDTIYRNKRMPPVNPGEVIAIMDSGAYFTSWESSFGFPRPAIAAVKNGEHRLLRRRESFSDMVARDVTEQ
ncbi:MAG: hypothetical protein JSV53_03715 [candidate division WOR-3 bacterium]|nr:MAG: hypothetical protein JSV53_03715 [candidate division WOR-3 bacterium]